MATKTISVTEYKALAWEDQCGWWPRYIAVKIKKVREYDECEYGHTHFLGWVERDFPVGEPLHYYWRTPTLTERLNHKMTPAALDSVLKSNVLTDRILSKSSKW